MSHISPTPVSTKWHSTERTFELFGPLAICCAHNAHCTKLLLPLNVAVILLVKFESSVFIPLFTTVLACVSRLGYTVSQITPGTAKPN